MATPTSTSPRRSESATSPISSSSNSLYLFTFLTTLLLLLAVSCGIILRSMILRHRFRQRLAAAIEAGILLPESLLDGNQSGSLGEKPKMYDVWLAPPSDIDSKEDTTSPASWHGVQPLSATILRPTNHVIGSGNERTVRFTHQMAADFWGIRTTPRRSFPEYLQSLRLRRSRDVITEAEGPTPVSRVANGGDVAPSEEATSSVPVATNEPALPLPQDNPEKLSVAVLIAMPNPNKRQYIPNSTTFISNRRDSISSSASATASTSYSSPIMTDDRGKQKALSYHPTDVRDVVVEEEEDLPEVVFGIAEGPWSYGSIDLDNVDGARELSGSESS